MGKLQEIDGSQPPLLTPPATETDGSVVSQDERHIFDSARSIADLLESKKLSLQIDTLGTLHFPLRPEVDHIVIAYDLAVFTKKILPFRHKVELFQTPEPAIVISMSPPSAVHNIAADFLAAVLDDWKTKDLPAAYKNRMKSKGSFSQPLFDGSLLEADGVIYLRPVADPPAATTGSASAASAQAVSSTKGPALALAIPDSAFPLIVVEVSLSQEREEAQRKIVQWIQGSRGRVKVGIVIDFEMRTSREIASSRLNTTENDRLHVAPKHVFTKCYVADQQNGICEAKALGRSRTFDPSENVPLPTIKIPPGALFNGHEELGLSLNVLRDTIREAILLELSKRTISKEVLRQKERRALVEEISVAATEARLLDEAVAESEETTGQEESSRRSTRIRLAAAATAAAETSKQRYHEILEEERAKAEVDIRDDAV